MLYIMQFSINSKGQLLSHALAVCIRLPLPPPFLSVPPPAANLGLSLAQLLLLNSPSCWFQNVSNRADPDLKALWQRKRRIDVSPLLSPISSRQHLTLCPLPTFKKLLDARSLPSGFLSSLTSHFFHLSLPLPFLKSWSFPKWLLHLPSFSRSSWFLWMLDLFSATALALVGSQILSWAPLRFQTLRSSYPARAFINSSLCFATVSEMVCLQ